jgi:hypothetical protein
MEYNYFGDKRLNKRYSKMVNQSMQHSQTTSAGLISVCPKTHNNLLYKCI